MSNFVIYLYFITLYIKITHTALKITIRVIKDILEVIERENKLKKINKNRKWKEENKHYLKELQSFFDKAANIEDENLKKSVISQMLRCDNILTKLAERRFMDEYKSGYNRAKSE